MSLPALSLKVRLGLGAALLAAGAIFASVALYSGMTRVAESLNSALAAEQRMSRYAVLSTQVSTFLVIATEAIQTGIAHDDRKQRLSPAVEKIGSTFSDLREGLEIAVADAEHLGIDQQARYGTQSLGIARMEALLDSSLRGLSRDTDDPAVLRAHIDSFASAFDPLLNDSVNAEVRFRAEILEGIGQLKESLTRTAILVGLGSLLLVPILYVWLVRPQFRRLDRLKSAAQMIAVEDFSLHLPETSHDEIGNVFIETNRAARALADRRTEVQAEWSRLNETIAQRTQELRDANARLEAIDENRRRFFADVSHELRTPLTVILMEAQLGQRTQADAKSAFATIEARTERLNRRIDDLLRVAKSESGQLALDPAPISLADVTQDVIEEVAPEIDSAGMVLSHDGIPNIHVVSDRNWLRQIVLSAIRNAIRHAKAGKVIHLGFSETDRTAGLFIKDNGPGIDPKNQQRVMERFQQGGASDGFGVGLALTKWVVSQLEGEMSLSSPAQPALGENPGLQISIRMPKAKP